MKRTQWTITGKQLVKGEELDTLEGAPFVVGDLVCQKETVLVYRISAVRLRESGLGFDVQLDTPSLRGQWFNSEIFELHGMAEAA